MKGSHVSNMLLLEVEFFASLCAIITLNHEHVEEDFVFETYTGIFCSNSITYPQKCESNI